MEPFLSFVKEVICNSDEELFRYVIGWAAHLTQHPDKKPGTALVLRGSQGTGKSTFASVLCRLFGPHAIVLASAQMLTRNFNSHIANRSLVVIEETPVRRKDANAVKQLITTDRLLCEPKGVDPFEISNHIHLVICTNESYAVHAQNDERRFVILDIAETYKENTEYFAKLTEWLEGGGDAALLHYLQSYELSGLKLRVVPKTRGLLEQKLQSLPLIERALYELLQTGIIERGREWTTPLRKKALVDVINKHRHRWESEASDQTAGVCVRKLFPTIKDIRGAGRFRERCWIFPPLDECRRSFERYLGQSIDWSKVED